MCFGWEFRLKVQEVLRYRLIIVVVFIIGGLTDTI